MMIVREKNEMMRIEIGVETVWNQRRGIQGY